MEIARPSNVEILQTRKQNQQIVKFLNGRNYEKYGRFIFAVLGSFNWLGGVMGAAAALKAEHDQDNENELIQRWMKEYQEKIRLLELTLNDMTERFEQLGEHVNERLQEENYLALVKQGFRIWDEANTNSKREHVRRTLINAAATKLCSDDIVRIFLNWIEKYDETHFRVIRVLFHDRGATRGFIWDEIGGADVREDSSEADLFKLLIFDLSTGHVLRQIRDKNEAGQFLKQRRRGRTRSTIMESAFDDTKPYELTALGQQFVTYVLNETVPRVN